MCIHYSCNVKRGRKFKSGTCNTGRKEKDEKHNHSQQTQYRIWFLLDQLDEWMPLMEGCKTASSVVSPALKIFVSIYVWRWTTPVHTLSVKPKIHLLIYEDNPIYLYIVLNAVIGKDWHNGNTSGLHSGCFLSNLSQNHTLK